MRKVIYILGAALMLAGCAKVNKQDAKGVHEAWLNSLNDSVAATRAQVETTLTEIDSLHAVVGSMLEDFDRVNNPRHVEPFTIAKGWAGKYPLTSTGVIARLTEGEQFELIAVLKGGTFTQLRAVSGSEEAQTEVVPFDQGLNYREGGLNTVAFTGAAADSVGRLIANTPEGSVSIYYGSSRHPLDRSQQEMIGRTWRLYDAHRSAQRLERSLPILQEKIKILEARLSREQK